MINKNSYFYLLKIKYEQLVGFIPSVFLGSLVEGTELELLWSNLVNDLLQNIKLYCVTLQDVSACVYYRNKVNSVSVNLTVIATFLLDVGVSLSVQLFMQYFVNTAFKRTHSHTGDPSKTLFAFQQKALQI